MLGGNLAEMRTDLYARALAGGAGLINCCLLDRT